MATVTKTLSKKTNTGTGTLQVLQQAKQDHTMRVDGLLLKLAVKITNSDASPHNLDHNVYGHNWKVKVNYADGSPWYDNIPLIGVERIAQIAAQGFLTNPVELAKSVAGMAAASDDKYGLTIALTEGTPNTVNAGAVVTDLRRSYQTEIRDRYVAGSGTAAAFHYFRLWLPLAQPLARNPLDFSQALSLIDTIEVSITNDTGSSYLTVTEFNVEAVAVGERVDNFYAGSRLRHFTQSVNIGMNEDVIPFSGERLLATHIYTTDDSGSPVAGVDLVAKLDDKHTIIELNNSTNVQVLNEQMGVVPGAFPANTERSFHDAVLIIRPSFRFSILDMPVSRGLNLHYGSNPGTAGKQFYVVTTIKPKSDRCRIGTYPGGAELTPANLARMTRILGTKAIDPSALAQVRDWLPEEVMTPQATGNPSCGA